MALLESVVAPRALPRANGAHNATSMRSKNRWRRRSRLLALVACDQVAISIAALASTLLLARLFPGHPWPRGPRLLAILSPAALLVLSTHGLYARRREEPGLELRRITLASCTLFGLLLLVSLSDGRVGTWSATLVLAWLLFLLLVPSSRAIARRLRAQLPWMRQRVLVLGDGEE